MRHPYHYLQEAEDADLWTSKLAYLNHHSTVEPSSFVDQLSQVQYYHCFVIACSMKDDSFLPPGVFQMT